MRKRFLRGVRAYPVHAKKIVQQTRHNSNQLVRLRSGMLVPGGLGVSLSKADLDIIAAKFVRGLYRSITEDILRLDVRIEHVAPRGETWSGCLAQRAIRGLSLGSVGSAFLYLYRIEGDEAQHKSHWYFYIWQQHFLAAKAETQEPCT